MTRNHRSTGSTMSKRAFTLIELLVVVAIIALLISILLPSLASAREGARAAVCLSSLKQMGNATIMYTMDNGSVLPGPVHNPIYHDTAKVVDLEITTGSLYWKLNLPYYIQNYMSDKSGRGKLVDQVLTCPTANRIPVADPLASGPAMYSLKPGDYIANTGGSTNAKARRAGAIGGVVDNHPYYGTKPRNYFGWENIPASYNNIAEHNRTDPESYSPKKIELIKQHAAEWMVADLWYWDGSYGPGLGAGMFGTWIVQKTTGATNSVFVGGAFKIPSYPYHNITRSFSSTDYSDSAPNSARLTTGKTNAVYFDGHSTGVRIWRGTVNPRFAADDVNKPPPPVID